MQNHKSFPSFLPKMQSKPNGGKHTPATILLVLSINNIIRNMGYSIVSISLPRYVRETLHMEYSAFGWLLGMFTIAQAILEPFFARLAETRGYKRAIIISLVIYFLGTILCGFATDFWTMLTFRAVQGTGAFYSAMLLYVNHSRPVKERPQAFATFSITMTIGWVLGIGIGGWLDTIIDIHAIFFVMAFMIGSNVAISVAFLPSTSDEARIVAEAQDSEKLTETERLPTENPWPRRRDYFILNAVNFTRNAAFQAVLSFLLFYIAVFLSIWGLPDGIKGIIILPMVITYIVFVLLGGARKVIERHGKVAIIIISFVILLPFIFLYGFFFQAMVGLPYGINAGWIWFLFILFTAGCAMGFGLPQAPVTALSMEYLPEKHAGYIAGLFNTVMFLAGAVGPVIFSAFVELEQVDLVSPPYISFIGVGVLLVFMIVLSSRLGKAYPQHAHVH